MKMTNELLIKYAKGQCAPEEKGLVEAWLSEIEHPDLPSYDDELDEITPKVWSRLSQQLPKGGAKVVPMYKRVMHYVAAACLAMGLFFAGHLSGRQSVSYASEIKQGKQLTDVLYIYGGNGTYGQVDNSRYRLKFEGTLRLHNSANVPKQIVCGKQEFTLEPHKTYFLSGSDQDAHLTEEINLPDAYDVYDRLDGTFSIKGIYD
ncbi:MAG: hypothetical protein AAF992_23615 [Bacteroidota bacterium]